MQILKGHTSPDTAYVVDDYPYGFRLRCKIRYWLEFNKSHGFRLVSQTTNPKRPGEVWNKPKASTYIKFGAVMYLNEEDHVTWAGLSEYTTYESAKKWYDTYKEGLSPEGDTIARTWVEMKRRYEEARKAKEVPC